MLKIKGNIKIKELEKYLVMLNIMDNNECIHKNVYCAVSQSNLCDIENNCIQDYDVDFFINENLEIDYCTYPENRNEDFILDTIYDLTKAGLVEKVKE